MADATLLGRFVWHELLTTDTKSAGTFFSKVIGWKTKPWGNDGSYTLFLAGNGQMMAGLMTLPDEAKQMGAPAHWLSYIGTPNVDDTARRAESLGGTILKAPTDIPTVGRFAVLADPQGAMFALFTPGQTPGPEAAAEVGDFSWHELSTSDLAAGLTFYKTLFGWEETSAMDMGPGLGVYQMFGRNGRTLGGMFAKPATMAGPSVWSAYIRVPDAKKTAAAVKKLGGQIIHGPAEVPGGDWIAQGLDLQGAMFAVHAVKPAAATTPVASAAKASPKAPAKKAAAQKAPAKKVAITKSAGKKVAAKAAPKKKAVSKGKAAKATKKGPTKKASRKSKAKAKGKTAQKAGKKRR